MFCNFVFTHEVCRPMVVAASSKLLSSACHLPGSCGVYKFSHNVQRHRQTDGRADNTVMPIVDYTDTACLQYDRLTTKRRQF